MRKTGLHKAWPRNVAAPPEACADPLSMNAAAIITKQGATAIQRLMSSATMRECRETLMMPIRETILTAFLSTVEETGGTATQPLTDNIVLLESGLDSLGFAVLVSRLEDELGYDPFSLADDPFYPSTFGEFVRFYEQNKPG